MSWHDTDPFWTGMGSAMFHDKRWERTPWEVERILTLLQVESGRILDMPCGPGRHSLELARRGYAVTGVDRTLAYLEQARTRAQNQGLEVEWIQGDMRAFRREATYDVALNLFSSVGYFDDPDEDRRQLENLVHSLKPGGQLLIETNSLEIVARTFTESSVVDLPDGSLIIERRRVVGPWTAIEADWTLLRPDGSREDRQMRVRLYSARHLAGLLHQVGLRDIEILGSLEGDPYDHKAQRLVILGRR